MVVLEAMPLTPNGKIDRRALPAPDRAHGDSAALVAPRDELEQQLLDIWQRVLQQAPIGVTSDFFALGGHSLLATRLVAEMRAVLGREMPLMMLLQNPTIEQLAAVLRGGAPPRANPLVGLRTQGTRPPLFLIHPVGGQVLAYRRLVELLGGDQPVYGLQSTELAGKATRTTIEEMATRYLAAIRSAAPAGPYLLGGWSLGGLIGFEIARQLQDAGEEVALLAMLDTYGPLPGSQSAEIAPDDAELMRLFVRDLGLDASGIDLPAGQPGTDDLEAITWRGIRLGVLPPATNPRDVADMFEIFKTNYHAMLIYRPRPYFGDVVLLRATETADPRVPPDRGWQAWVGGTLTIHPLEGNHFTILQEPQVRGLASTLADYLQAAQVGETT
jgi:thioesterase domain-containing protein/aryl carrier-like protein